MWKPAQQQKYWFPHSGYEYPSQTPLPKHGYPLYNPHVMHFHMQHLMHLQQQKKLQPPTIHGRAESRQRRTPCHNPWWLDDEPIRWVTSPPGIDLDDVDSDLIREGKQPQDVHRPLPGQQPPYDYPCLTDAGIPDHPVLHQRSSPSDPVLDMHSLTHPNYLERVSEWDYHQSSRSNDEESDMVEEQEVRDAEEKSDASWCTSIFSMTSSEGSTCSEIAPPDSSTTDPHSLILPREESISRPEDNDPAPLSRSSGLCSGLSPWIKPHEQLAKNETPEQVPVNLRRSSTGRNPPQLLEKVAPKVRPEPAEISVNLRKALKFKRLPKRDVVNAVGTCNAIRAGAVLPILGGKIPRKQVGGDRGGAEKKSQKQVAKPITSTSPNSTESLAAVVPGARCTVRKHKRRNIVAAPMPTSEPTMLPFLGLVASDDHPTASAYGGSGDPPPTLPLSEASQVE